MLTFCLFFLLVVCYTFEAFKLQPLPFAENALEPFISSETIQYHYGKHHQGYVNKLNTAAKADTSLQSQTIEEIIVNTGVSQKVLNLASQIYNHDFYWNCLTKIENVQKVKPSRKLMALITRKYNTFDNFKKTFSTNAKTHFGSGWIWLVYNNESTELDIFHGHDATCPIRSNLVPLLTIDVWEHAYYVDYRNNRGKYVDTFWNYINWEWVNNQVKENVNVREDL